MAKFNKVRMIFGLFLLPLVAAGSIAAHLVDIPAWPAFIIMIFFFLGHMDKKLVPNMIVGAAFGILMIIPIGILISFFGSSIGVYPVILIFTLVFVYLIVAFGEMVPILFNNYAFTALLITGVEMQKSVRVNPFKLVAVEVIGGLIFIGGILGIVKILTAMAAKKKEKS